jgi:hypothetical protein
MSYQGDAAEQVVRLSLETGEIAVRLAGSGAKQVAVLLYAILKDQQKTKGKTRLSSLLRSGKELKVFAVKDGDLKKFCQEAKKYGVLYCVLKDRDATDGITDIMVRAEDAGKINRIFERFQLATVDMAQLRQEIERSVEKNQEDTPEEAARKEQETDSLLDDLLSPATPKEAAEQEVPPPENPSKARIGEGSPSGPISMPKEAGEWDVSDPSERSRPSVRQALKEIREEQKKEETQAKEKPEPQKSPKHKAPQKKKTGKQKAR